MGAKLRPMHDIADELGSSPEWFPYELNIAAESLAFVRLKRSDYEGASFLDGRVLTPASTQHSLPWERVEAAIESAQLPERCGFIFHIGHVGSTLLSRLIGAHPGAFSIREPLVLRTLAQLVRAPEAQLAGCLKLLSRTFQPRQLAIIKASSFVSELATRLMARASAPRAVMMSVAPESYMATILGGPNSRQEAKVMAPARLSRLQRRIGVEAWQLHSMSEGEIVAMSWACEMCALAEAARDSGERALWIDFDQFLVSPTRFLAAALRHLHLEADAAIVASLLAGPDMRRYSKAPEYAYDAQLRVEVLNQARMVHGSEIGRGLAWLDHAAARFAHVRDAIKIAR
jgi:hypothetical protein